jgi:four helix bundle protein
MAQPLKNKSPNQHIMYTYSSEKFNVWQQSRELVKEIYRLTRKFPVEERFGLTSQIRRVSISVSSNLAEGSARKTANDHAHFTTIAQGSLMEILNQLILATDLDFIEDSELLNIRPKIEKIGNKLNSLRNSQYQRASKG